ncbi:MFS transporter [Cerasicoccus fimbriatus]|uniref:MFS transporter n=1 Tax=Cerasicoccus fimbriatus TaxID=3014554 RepID=UPI0022B47386|nr:MFS transporter [Cerasicoccus sp. TK19100]
MGLADVIYRRLSGDENGAQANDITEEAAKHVPRNFLVQVIGSVATKTGDQLFSPRLLLTWLMASIGAPAAAISLIVPVRESLSLLPQITAAAMMRQHAIRKWFLVGGSVTQAASILLMITVALLFEGALAGWLLLALLALFSLGRVFQSITSKELTGKTLPKQRRGLAGGTASALAGGGALLVAAYFIFLDEDDVTVPTLCVILGIAAALWLLGAILFAQLKELPSEVDDDGNGFVNQLKSGLRELKQNRGFRSFIAVRTGLIGNALVLPMVVMIAFQESKGSAQSLGILMGGSGLAALLSSYIWGRLSDKSSRLVLIIVGYLGATLAGVSILIAQMNASTTRTVLVMLVFFALAVVHQGTRIGRKTYVIDLANADNRSTLVALANTLIGIALILLGGISGALSSLGYAWAIGFCALISLGGALLGHGLDDVQS